MLGATLSASVTADAHTPLPTDLPKFEAFGGKNLGCHSGDALEVIWA